MRFTYPNDNFVCMDLYGAMVMATKDSSTEWRSNMIVFPWPSTDRLGKEKLLFQ